MREVQEMKVLCRRRTLGLLAIALFLGVSCYMHWDSAFQFLVRIPAVGWLIEYNFPPSDFYEPLDKTSLQSGSIKLEFTCKYRGRYEIQIRGINSALFWESNVGMNIVIRNRDGCVLYNRNNNNARILGGADGDYNYCYGIFNAPRDLPLGVKLIAEITCYGEVKELLRHFPDAEIVAIKAFDK